MVFYEMVGKRILDKLNQKGWKQQDLADRLNISKQVMSKILKGEKNTTIVEIRNIADILDVDVNTLLKPQDSVSDINKNLSIQPIFMGRVTTEIGKSSIKKADMVIDMINKYEELANMSFENKNKTINFSKLTKKKEYKPNI